MRWINSQQRLLDRGEKSLTFGVEGSITVHCVPGPIY